MKSKKRITVFLSYKDRITFGEFKDQKISSILPYYPEKLLEIHKTHPTYKLSPVVYMDCIYIYDRNHRNSN